ncbi:MAG: hypothetical protein WCP91_01880 [Candidatus Berkelbacteria bacterium]
MEDSKAKYEQLLDSHYSSQAHKKLWNYFLALSKTDEFINLVADLRKKYKIPKDGFISEERISPPPRLENRFNADHEIIKAIEEYCLKYGLHPLGFFMLIEDHIYYGGELEPDDGFSQLSLCTTSDLFEESIDPFDPSTQEADNKLFPIAIRLSPYATERDILDFVKKTYKTTIKPALDMYKNKDSLIGKIKARDGKIQERNEFIYQNRNLSLKELSDKVSDKFKEHLDEGLIGKIRSIELKRRKEL